VYLVIFEPCDGGGGRGRDAALEDGRLAEEEVDRCRLAVESGKSCKGNKFFFEFYEVKFTILEICKILFVGGLGVVKKFSSDLSQTNHSMMF